MKLTWTVMAVLPTPPSPRTVILKSIRAEGPFLFSFRFLASRQKSAIVFLFCVSRMWMCGFCGQRRRDSPSFGDWRLQRREKQGCGCGLRVRYKMRRVLLQTTKQEYIHGGLCFVRGFTSPGLHSSTFSLQSTPAARPSTMSSVNHQNCTALPRRPYCKHNQVGVQID